MAEKRQCAKYVSSGRASASLCSLNAIINRDGKWYCGIHDPVKVQERRTLRKAKWDEKWKRAENKRKAGELGIKLAEFIEEHLLSNGDTQGKAIDMALEVIDTLNGEKQ